MLPAWRRRWSRTATGSGQWLVDRFDGPHGARTYDLYLPGDADRGGSIPLVLLLHGCRQTSVRFAEQSGFRTAADREGFAVLSPRQEARHQLNRCWRWYETEHQIRGSGEPALLADLARDAAATFPGIDDRRIYVAGLSAGGAMALILAATYPDVFAAAGVHSATAYRSATRGLRAWGAMSARATLPPHDDTAGRMAPMIVVHGTNDQVVRPPNADRIVDQWLASWDSHPRRGAQRIRPLASTRSAVVAGRRTIRTRWYTVGGRAVLEYWRVDGLAHAWSGGEEAGDYVDPEGPDAAGLMVGFFGRHRTTLEEHRPRPWWRRLTPRRRRGTTPKA